MRPGTKKWKLFMAKLYGIGAAVVIMGALFKIMHWPFAGPMLVVGLSVEAVIFFFSAFEPLHEDPKWELVYPELALAHDEEFDLHAYIDEKGDSGVSGGAEKGLSVSEQFDNLLEEAESLLVENNLSFSDVDSSLQLTNEELSLFELTDSEMISVNQKTPTITLVDTLEISDDWDSYMSQVNKYAQKNELDFCVDPFQSLLSKEQRDEIEKRLNEDYKFKNAHCDKYDYMIAATCGTIGGLIDVFFVGLPGQGACEFRDR